MEKYKSDLLANYESGPTEATIERKLSSYKDIVHIEYRKNPNRKQKTIKNQIPKKAKKRIRK